MSYIVPSSIEYIRAGRALAVSTAIRSEALPDIPTIGEFLPGYEVASEFPPEYSGPERPYSLSS
jgi:tripartite-type tricarboxylate transporter receptor subunit TctC